MNNKPLPLVSIIIPCYNQGKILLETVESALNQNYKPVEIIVINDGSTDLETLETLKNLPASVKQITIENSGPSVARNIAVRQSKGKYIVPLDADDLIENKTLMVCIPILESNASVAVVYGDNQKFGAEEGVIKQSHFSARTILLFNSIAFCTVIRKDAYIKVGGLDEWMSKRGLEDWELWIRLNEAGWLFHHVDELFFKIRVQFTSRTYLEANKNLEELKKYVWNKHSASLAKQYELMYHDCKNLPQSLDYRLGRFVLSLIRKFKKLLN